MKHPARVFTDTWLRGLKRPADGKRYAVTEQGRKGFQLRVSETGTRTFGTRFQLSGQSPGFVTYGEYGDSGPPFWTLQQAHEAHETARKLVKRGIDPRTVEWAPTNPDDPQSPQNAPQGGGGAPPDHATGPADRGKGDVLTVRNAIAEFMWYYARKQRKRPRDALWTLKKNFRPWFKDDVRIKRRRDAVELLDGIVRRGAPVGANRFCRVAGQMFRFLLRERAWNEKGLEANPFADLGQPGGEEGSRDRVLAAREIRVYWHVLADPEGRVVQEHIRLGLQLMLVTGQRGGEVRKAKPQDFDLKARRWIIRDTKNGHEHVVPLTDLAVEIVERLLVLSAGKKYLFPHRHKAKAGKPIGKQTFSRALRNLRMGKKHGKRGQRPKRLQDGPLSEVAPFVPHDSRRTVVTNLADLGTSRFVIKKIINHRKKRKSKHRDVTDIYDRHDYWGRKLRALRKWDRRLQHIIGRDRVVVPLAA